MGREFKFNMGGKGESLKTLIGGISTITQIICFMVLLWYYGQDMYLRKSPSMIKSEGMTPNYIEWKADSSNFNFAFNLQSSTGANLIDPRDFIYELSYISVTTMQDGSFKFETTTKEMEQCSLKHFKNETLYNNKLYSSFCIENNFTIGGQWNTGFIMVPSFLVRRCNADIEKKLNIKCRTNEEIISKYKTIYTNIFIQKNLIDPSLYENPIQEAFVIKSKQLDILSQDVSKQTIYYSTAELITDTGFMYKDTTKIDFLELET